MMRSEELDQLLRSEALIEPSPGFADAVMATIGRELASPGPLPFPWRRAAPALVLAGGCLVVTMVYVGTLLAGAPAAAAALDTIPGPVAWLAADQRWVSVLAAVALLGSLLVIGPTDADSKSLL
jgi:hypothetical protein